MNKTQLIEELYKIEAIKFGEFKLKSGVTSPVYIDLRQIISYPTILRGVAQAMWEKAAHLKFDFLCGVPYTALPIATCMSLEHQKPMVMCRKEAKDYGTKKMVEGAFKPGQTCLIIEDVITSAGSVLQSVATLENEGLVIKDVIALVDREQGGCNNLSEKNYQLHSVFTLSEIIAMNNK